MKTDILDARHVPARDCRDMLELMLAHYDNVRPDRFATDLAAKDQVAVIRDGDRIRGFSTLVSLDLAVAGRPVRVFFSGDTVMAESLRNSVALPFAVARVMVQTAHRRPEVPVYWLLTSKGYKTYRAMTVFFRDAFPRAGRVLSAFETALLTDACARLFARQPDCRPDRWLLPAADGDQRLRPGVADLDDRLRGRSDIALFERLNPGHARGDELICLGLVAPANLRQSLFQRLAAP